MVGRTFSFMKFMKSIESPRDGSSKTTRSGPGISMPQTCSDFPPCCLLFRKCVLFLGIQERQLSGPSLLNRFSCVKMQRVQSTEPVKLLLAKASRVCSFDSTIALLAYPYTKSTLGMGTELFETVRSPPTGKIANSPCSHDCWGGFKWA